MLTTESLRIGYALKGRQHILFDDLNLSLKAGNLVCFMGPNGSGKSSLIRTLSGLQKPLSGNVRLNGESTEFDPKLIAVVLTDKVSAGSMTVFDLISYGRYPYLDWRINLTADDKRLIELAIDHVRVRHLLKMPLEKLSDGQLQMVMIARALAQDTPILLLDEPTSHLDLNNRLEIMKVLKKVAKTLNKAILMATHELDLALQTADEVWLAGLNKNILRGIPEDLVLNNEFDQIFQFKGYDLKSGKVEHDVFRKISVSIEGAGAELLWTKNAVERSGFEVKDLHEQTNYELTRVQIIIEETKPRWVLHCNNRQYKVSTIAALIEHLESIDCGSLA